MRAQVLSSLLVLFLANNVSAGPLKEVAEGVGDTVGYVGKTAGDTAKAVGKSIGDSAERLAGDVDPVAARREVDGMANQTLNKLLTQDPKAKALFDISYGYAIFDSRKTSFLFTVGRGAGVAVNKKSGARTYMQMAAAGANLGAGLKFFQNVFLFENKQAFDNFVNRGWEAGTSGGGTLGRNSVEADVRFSNGMALFQLTETGVMLSADVTGTKYWKDGTLNG